MKKDLIGKRVEVTYPEVFHKRGRVLDWSDRWGAYAVEMDGVTQYQHDCQGRTEPNRGLWVKEGNMFVIPDKETSIHIGDYVSFVHNNEHKYGNVYTYDHEVDMFGIKNGDTNYWICADNVYKVEQVEPVEENEPAAPNAHYQTNIQPIEFMQANMTPEEFIGFLKGNIIKYTARCGKKDDPNKEVDKIIQYAEWLRDAFLGNKIDPRE